jgi:hypothetical protein
MRIVFFYLEPYFPRLVDPQRTDHTPTNSLCLSHTPLTGLRARYRVLAAYGTVSIEAMFP